MIMSPHVPNICHYIPTMAYYNLNPLRKCIYIYTHTYILYAYIITQQQSSSTAAWARPSQRTRPEGSSSLRLWSPTAPRTSGARRPSSETRRWRGSYSTRKSWGATAASTSRIAPKTSWHLACCVSMAPIVSLSRRYVQVARTKER